MMPTPAPPATLVAPAAAAGPPPTALLSMTPATAVSARVTAAARHCHPTMASPVWTETYVPLTIFAPVAPAAARFWIAPPWMMSATPGSAKSDGSCAAAAANEAQSCDDANACTQGDICSGGVCAGTSSTTCSDNNPCTDDSCDPAAGCVSVDNSASCDDGDACSTGDRCSAGACTAGAPRTCDDGETCTDDHCDPASGCVFVLNGTPCEAVEECTLVDVADRSGCNESGDRHERDGERKRESERSSERNGDSDRDSDSTKDCSRRSPRGYARISVSRGRDDGLARAELKAAFALMATNDRPDQTGISLSILDGFATEIYHAFVPPEAFETKDGGTKFVFKQKNETWIDTNGLEKLEAKFDFDDGLVRIEANTMIPAIGSTEPPPVIVIELRFGATLTSNCLTWPVLTCGPKRGEDQDRRHSRDKSTPGSKPEPRKDKSNRLRVLDGSTVRAQHDHQRSGARILCSTDGA